MENRPTLSSNENKKPGFFYGYIVVAIAFFIVVTVWGAFYSFGVFLKPLLAEFGWTRAVTSGAFSLSIIMFGSLGIITGRLTDRFGARKVVTVSGLFLGIGYLLMSQVNTIWHIYLFYGVITAIGLGCNYVPVVSTVGRWFVKKRGMVTGITVSGIGIGTLIWSPLANWLISNYGWRTSYVIVGGATSLLVILAAQWLRHSPGQMGQLPYGESELMEKNEVAPQGFTLKRTLNAPQFWMLGVAYLCLFFSEKSIVVHIVPHAIDLGFSAASSAAILAVYGGLGTGGRILMGIVSDRIGIKKILVICTFLPTAVLFWLLTIKELWMLYLFSVIFGFGYGGLSAVIAPAMLERFGLTSHGVILGVTMFGLSIGETIGPVLSGHIFDITGSYSLAFLICAIANVIGLTLFLLLKSVQMKKSIPSTGLSS
ncbi:MFS transporter [Chloroflexota bacterium]